MFKVNRISKYLSMLLTDANVTKMLVVTDQLGVTEYNIYKKCKSVIVLNVTNRNKVNILFLKAEVKR